MINLFKKNIKWRTTFIFIIVMVCSIGSIVLFNSLFLEKLYINKRKDVLIKTYNLIDQGVTDAKSKGLTLSDLFKKTRFYIPGPDGKIGGLGNRKNIDKDATPFEENDESSLAKMLRELMTVHNISVVFVDDKNVKYSIFSNNQRFEDSINSFIFGDIDKNDEYNILDKNNDYTIAMHKRIESYGFSRRIYAGSNSNNKNKQSQNTNREITEIECFGFLSDNETEVFMTSPIMSIKEPIALFNGVLIFASIIVIIIGSFIIYLTSSQLSKPIIKLASLSKKMADMDFDTKYDGKSEDEIGVLGDNFNELSNKLEKTIKELKNANIMLKNDLEQKEKLDNMRKDFIASVSHELKTPIALIEGYAEALEGNIAENKEDRDFYVKVIKDEANKMNKQVMQLLNLMELEKNIDDMDIERIKLKDVVDGVLESESINIKNGNINVESAIASDITVWADEYRLEEIITNFITNAIHHVDDKKKIKIWCEKNNNADDKVRFYVHNTCAPLPEEALANIWNQYYKVDKARTREYGGTGLGLSIVKAIAKKMGVDCGVENIDEGVRFYIDLLTK